jgi:AraC-like DNA-binding protein
VFVGTERMEVLVGATRTRVDVPAHGFVWIETAEPLPVTVNGRYPVVHWELHGTIVDARPKSELRFVSGYDPIIAQLGESMIEWLQEENCNPAAGIPVPEYLVVRRLRKFLDSVPVCAVGAAPARESRFRSLLAFIDEHLAETLPVDKLAKRVCCSPHHFARTFREMFGVSPHRYLLSRRVSRACELLAMSDMPLAEVALHCGFANQSHMTNTFAKLRACTPLHYRKRVGSGVGGDEREARTGRAALNSAEVEVALSLGA